MALTRIDSYLVDLDSLGGITFDDQAGVPTFKVDAVNHRVGIGTASPAQKLDVADGDIALRKTTGGDNSGVISQVLRIGTQSGDLACFYAISAGAGGPGGRGGDLHIQTKQNNGAPTDRLVITETGNVGIGTTNPGHRLVVYGAAAANEIRSSDGTVTSQWYQDSSGFGVFGTTSNHHQVFRTNGSEKMRISSGGYVGIGTSNPLDALQVHAAGFDIVGGNAINGQTMAGIKITNSQNTDSSVGVWFGTSTSHWSGISGQRSNYLSNWGTDLRFYTHEDATNDLTYTRERLRITSNGNVGIGSTAPGTKLDVSGNIRGERYVGINSLVLNTYTTINPSSNVFLYSQPNDRDSWIYLDSADTGSNWGIYHRQIDSAVADLPSNSIGFVGGGATAVQSYISLQTGNAYFRGNVGIGSTVPGENITVYRSVDAGSQVRNHNASAGSNAFAAYRLSSDVAGSTWWWLNSSARTVDGGASTSTIRNDAGDMRLQAAGEVGLHIKASTGNIGIGVPNPSAKLTVDGSINQTWSDVRLGIFYDNSFRQGLAYSTSERTLKIFSTTSDSGGNIAFYTRNGPGASDTDYGTQRMVISAAGNVGIGTTNPGARFEISGTTADQFAAILSNPNNRVRGDYQRGFGTSHPVAIIGNNDDGTDGESGNLALCSGDLTPTSGQYCGTLEFMAPESGKSNANASMKSLIVGGLEGSGGSVGGLGGNIQFWTKGDNASGVPTERLRITASGNVGIGTTNPGVPLDVRGTDSLIRASETGSGTAWRARIISHNPDGAVQRASFLGVYGTSAGVFAHTAALNGWAPLFVNTTNGSSDGDTVILAGSGSVGIGTINPSAKLHVNATGRAATIGGTPGGNPAGTVATQTSYLELVAGSGGNTNSSAVVFHNPGVSTAALEYLNADANTGYFNFKSDDATWNVGIGLTNPSYKLDVNGRTNFSDNMKITPTSESWAEGLQFYMPTTSTWGGVRWVRNRTNYHGSWYQGWTALDSSNDMVFGHNASGTQVDNILRLYGSASGSARIGRDLYIAGHAGGNYGNRLVVGGTDTVFTAQDSNLRPTIQATGQYPVVSINHTLTGNTSHGPTLQFTCNGVGHQFVIGTTGNGSRMDIGFSSTGDWNPHNGISNYQGTTSMSFATSGNVGVGTTQPTSKLEVQGGNLRVGGGGYSRTISGYRQANAAAFDMFQITGLSGHCYLEITLHHFHSGGGMHGSYKRSAMSLNSYTTWIENEEYSMDWQGGLGFSFTRTSTDAFKVTWNGATSFSTDFYLYCEIKSSNNFSVSNIGMNALYT